MFSPLMSPAMTPHSSYSAASSLPPSASFLPSNPNLITPAELFAGLGSPAMLPQAYQLDPTAGWPLNSSSLQGLVDQTKALAFDPSQYRLSDTPPNNASNGAAVDAGQATATGSGRRGAGTGSRKTRPSPLLKPTPDAAIRKKKGEKRSSSIGSAGSRSVTNSPYLGATQVSSGGIAPLTSSASSSRATPASNKPSPEDSMSGSSGGAINTPSPVDLDISEAPGPMAPPPPPSQSHSRRGSAHSLSDLPSVPTSQFMHPVTPASLMNFSSDLSSAGLAMSVGSHAGRQLDSNLAATSAQQSSKAAPAKPRKKALTSLPQSVEDAGPVASTSHQAIGDASASAVPNGLAPTVSTNAKGKARATTASGAAGTPAPARKLAAKPGPRVGVNGPKIKPLLASGKTLPRVPMSSGGALTFLTHFQACRQTLLLGCRPKAITRTSWTVEVLICWDSIPRRFRRSMRVRATVVSTFDARRTRLRSKSDATL